MTWHSRACPDESSKGTTPKSALSQILWDQHSASNLPGEIWRSLLSHIWGNATPPYLGRPITLVSVIHIVPLKIESAPGMPAQANAAIASVTDMAQFPNGTSRAQPSMMSHMSHSLNLPALMSQAGAPRQNQSSHRYREISIQRATFPGRSGGASDHIYEGTPLRLSLADP